MRGDRKYAFEVGDGRTQYEFLDKIFPDSNGFIQLVVTTQEKNPTMPKPKSKSCNSLFFSRNCLRIITGLECLFIYLTKCENPTAIAIVPDSATKRDVHVIVVRFMDESLQNALFVELIEVQEKVESLVAPLYR